MTIQRKTQFARSDGRPHPDRAPVRHRLTVVDAVYFSPHDGQPIEYRTPFGRELLTDERPYSRPLTVGPEWVEVDLGWLKDVGVSMVVVQNDEGRYRQTVPSPEERASESDRVVEVAAETGVPPFALVRPTESCRFEPARATGLALRCRSGSAKVTVVLVPA